MITNLLLKFSSNKKTSKLTLNRANGKTVRQAARNESVQPGVYVFDQTINIHESHSEVRGLIGKKVLMFRAKGSQKKVYVYEYSPLMSPVTDAVSVNAVDFLEICAGLVRGVSTLEVKSAFFLWGCQNLQGPGIPGQYRQLFGKPLMYFGDPSDAFVRQQQERQERERLEAKRRFDDQARAAEAESHRRAAEAVKARQEAARKDKEKAEQEQRAKAQARASQPPKRPTAKVNRAVPNRGIRSTSRAGYTGSTYHDDDDDLADFMFMSMFPDVAPIYRPNSFMAWYLWSQNHHDNGQQPFAGAGGQFDGGGASGDWGPVPGFPDAVSQRVTPYGESQRVELLDSNGASVGSFIVTQNNGTTQFTAPGGHVFTVADDNAPTIEYANDAGQRFSWDGTNEPVIGTVQDNNEAPQGFTEPGVLDFAPGGYGSQSSGSDNSNFDVDTSGVIDNVTTPDDSSSVSLESDTPY